MSTSFERAGRGLRAEWRLHAISVTSLSVAFLCLGAALLVVVNLQGLEGRWGRLGRASVYLKDGAPVAEVDAIVNALRATPEVRTARYLSPGEARTALGAMDNTLAALPVEAFPASIEVDLVHEASDGEVAAIVTKLGSLPAVESVETYGSWTDRIRSVLRAGTLAAGCLAAVVFAAVLAVVGSTMRLALARRKTEVEVLRLVGATDGFVRTPFVLEGTFQGLLGAATSLVLLGILYQAVRVRADDAIVAILGMAPSFLPWPVVLGVLAMGGGLGALGGALGLRRLTTV